jgi:hypothetical protein
MSNHRKGFGALCKLVERLMSLDEHRGKLTSARRGKDALQ